MYKKILRIARKKGDDWMSKIKNESMLFSSSNKNNNDNIFTRNLLENSGTFSFGGENTVKDHNKLPNNISATKPFSKHHILDDSLNHELYEQKRSKGADDREQNEPLTVDSLLKESYKNPGYFQNSEGSTDFSAIYRNPSFKQKDYISRSNINIVEPHPYPERIRYQFPPTRDSKLKLISSLASSKKSLKSSEKKDFRKHYKNPKHFDSINDRSISSNFIDHNKIILSGSPDRFGTHSFDKWRSQSTDDEGYIYKKKSINSNMKKLKMNAGVRLIKQRIN